MLEGERRKAGAGPLKPVNPRKGSHEMNRWMIASVGTVLFTSGLAFDHGGGKGLARYYRDGNGAVTRDEMRTTEAERFDKMHTNKDGRLTLDEIQAAHRERAAKHF